MDTSALEFDAGESGLAQFSVDDIFKQKGFLQCKSNVLSAPDRTHSTLHSSTEHCVEVIGSLIEPKPEIYVGEILYALDLSVNVK